VHKPVGETSASRVDAFRRAHAGNFTLKVSHGGVLDPFAEGLVVLLVGAANKLFEALHEAPKTYVAGLRLGVETDTGDLHGKPIPGPGLSSPGLSEPVEDGAIERALESFRGWTDQIPPATSNKRIDGERAYQKAHRGEDVVLPPSPVFLQSARVLSRTGDDVKLELVVRGGFYVRSLARDLGRLLRCGAHVTTLARTAIGPYVDAVSPVQHVGRAVLPWLPSLELDDAQWGALKQGTLPKGPTRAAEWALPPGFPEPKSGVRAFHQGRLVALISADGATILPGGI
jgi:tRNA pseudouridine55 synthase